MMQLVEDNGTNTPIQIGQKVTTFRNEVVTLQSVQPPRHEGSTGRVYCLDKNGNINGWYPGVIGARFVEQD